MTSERRDVPLPSPAVMVWNPNPTLDVVSTVRALQLGAVHSADEQTVSAGGKGTLVLRGLELLGVNAIGVGPLAGVIGTVIRRLIDDEGLPMVSHEVDGQSRVAVTIADGRHRDTNVNGPGPTASGLRWSAHVHGVASLLARTRPSYFVVAGRPPVSVAVEDMRRLLTEAVEAGAKVVLDVSSPHLERLLSLRPWLVKVNVQEAQQALNANLTGAELVARVQRAGAENVILTDGPNRVRGSLVGLAFETDPPVVNVISAVGCGDSFLAGLLAAMSSSDSALELERLVESAVGAGSASAENLRPGYFDPARASELARRVVVDRL